jgi:hypothetical protein
VERRLPKGGAVECTTAVVRDAPAPVTRKGVRRSSVSPDPCRDYPWDGRPWLEPWLTFLGGFTFGPCHAVCRYAGSFVL